MFYIMESGTTLECFRLIPYWNNQYCMTIKVCSHRTKVNAKAKKIKEQSEEIKKISGKHQRKFSLSLGVNRP